MSTNVQLDIPREQIAEFCRRHHIQKLSLFGSVLRGDFRQDSDVDVLVEFAPEAQPSLFDFVRIQSELGTLFGHHVDPVDRVGLRNPFRRYEILRTQRVIFES